MNFPAKNRVIRGGEHLTRKQTIAYVLILGAAMAMIPFTIDPFLPSFPAIADYFGVESRLIQLSLTSVTIGFALGQLIIGPLSDAYGRRRPLLVVTALFAISTVAVIFSPTAEVFIVLRLLMGMSAAAATVIAQAIIRDLFSGMSQMKMLARTYLIQGAAPIIGPLVGSAASEFSGWQTMFWIMAMFGLLLLIGNHRYLIETLPIEKRRASTPRGLLRGYRNVIRDRIYVGLVLFAGFQISALFVYLNTVPFLYQETFGLSEGEFGLAFAMSATLSWLGVQTGSRLPKLFPPQWLLLLYAFIGIGVGLALILTSSAGEFWLAQGLFGLLLFNFGSTLTSIQTIALLNHGEQAGTAAGLLGVSNFTFTSIFSLFYGFIATTNTADIGLVIGGFYALALVSLVFISQPQKIERFS
ncbi:MAG: multidrug effflux MFS transporter [Microbacteriaceae bacterium]|nr:multidrug effflux MFS transporter [Microbacteriaceae bacterium]MDR9444020.1 multidrug effflux MFS transporter [Microbacteriaceae bacterium]